MIVFMQVLVIKKNKTFPFLYSALFEQFLAYSKMSLLERYLVILLSEYESKKSDSGINNTALSLFMTQNNGHFVSQRQYTYSECVKGALHPSNAKRLYMDKKSTEIGEIKSRIIGK